METVIGMVDKKTTGRSRRGTCCSRRETWDSWLTWKQACAFAVVLFLMIALFIVSMALSSDLLATNLSAFYTGALGLGTIVLALRIDAIEKDRHDSALEREEERERAKSEKEALEKLEMIPLTSKVVLLTKFDPEVHVLLSSKLVRVLKEAATRRDAFADLPSRISRQEFDAILFPLLCKIVAGSTNLFSPTADHFEDLDISSYDKLVQDWVLVLEKKRSHSWREQNLIMDTLKNRKQHSTYNSIESVGDIFNSESVDDILSVDDIFNSASVEDIPVVDSLYDLFRDWIHRRGNTFLLKPGADILKELTPLVYPDPSVYEGLSDMFISRAFVLALATIFVSLDPYSDLKKKLDQTTALKIWTYGPRAMELFDHFKSACGKMTSLNVNSYLV